MVARTEGRRLISYEPLVEGFLPKADGAGGRGATKAATVRPVDVLQMPDGSNLISDRSGLSPDPLSATVDLDLRVGLQ